jgi:hypothetical protein
MTQTSDRSTSTSWAHFRFSVVGALLSAPPARGELKAALLALAAKSWKHPISGREVQFAPVTLERWYYTARREQHDPVRVLRRAVRKDCGQVSLPGALTATGPRSTGSTSRRCVPCSPSWNAASLPYTTGDWWRALLVVAHMTGWRIGQILALRWQDVDLEAGTAKTQAEDTKGKRDAIVGLHPMVIEHLRRLRSFDPCVFPWQRGRRDLWPVFHEIQEAAGLSEPYYRFHDLRRAFATVNADSMSADALQHLMQHKDYSTTKRYINMAHQVKAAVANLHVPEFLRKKNA